MRIQPSSLLALALWSCAAAERERPPQPVPADTPTASDAAQPDVGSPPVAAPQPVAEAPSAPQTEAEEPAQPEDETRRLARLAQRAIEAGDYVQARALLDDILTVPKIAEARVLLAQGRDEQALVVTTLAAGIAPSEPRVLVVHAEACLRVGLRAGARERVEEALRTFLRAGASPEAWLGASRAARELGKQPEALEYAREGRRALAERGAGTVTWSEAPERTVALALWNSYEAAPREASSSAELDALGAETTEALSQLVGIAPNEAWGWMRLADVAERRARPADAQSALERGFARLPSDEALGERLARVARSAGGSAAVLESLERVRAEAPDAALAWSLSARERFERALEPGAVRPLEELRTAEVEFAAARERAPRRAAELLQREALCRAAVGWRQLSGGQLELAADSFRSMEKLARGAMTHALPGRVGSGVDGLAAVADAWAARGELPQAARLYLELHRYQPDVIQWAAAAGRFHRDAAEQARANAEDFQLVADGRITEPRRVQALRERAKIDLSIPIGPRLITEFRLAAEEQRKRARKGFEASYACFLDASRLAPDDIRVMADAALIAVEYLRDDLDRARGLLKASIALGEKQLQAAGLDEARRARLRQAWGDAHEYLGILYLERDGDPKRALEYFQKSLEIGPSARPSVEELYLPRCRQLLQRRP